MKNVDETADEIGHAKFDALPERVQEALGELAGAAKEGLLALSVGVGLGVLSELMAEEVDVVVGPKGRHDADRVAVRHGSEGGQVTLGGRRVPVERPPEPVKSVETAGWGCLVADLLARGWRVLGGLVDPGGGRAVPVGLVAGG